LALIAALFSYGCICGPIFPETCPADYAPVCGEDGETYYNDCYARQAGVEIAYNGSCSACNDSESTGDIFAYGEVVYIGITYADACYDETNVIEYYCSEGELVRDVKPCPEGYLCSDGICSSSDCEDSDGMDVHTKGTVTKGNLTYTDSCSDEGVVEYYCADGQIASMTTSCPSGYECSDGACVAAGCVDTEEGTSVSIAGTVTKGDRVYADSCYDADTVLEYYCSGGEVKSQYSDCSAGYYCNEGICEESTDCEDSDGGQKIYTKGTITKGSSTYSDYCIDDDTVYEYFCNFNYIASDWIDCPSGYECDDGACERFCTETDSGNDQYEKGTLTWGTSEYEDVCVGSQIREYYCGGTGGYTYSQGACPSGFDCDDGACVYSGTDCTDSDGGVDRYDKGTVISDGDYDIDYCIDSDTLREYYCGTGGDAFSLDLDCPEDYSCEDGECVYNPTDDCSDTDGGQDIYEAGTVTEDSLPYTDYCYDINTVWEYYCMGDSAQVVQKECPTDYECVSGECVYSPAETCSDTDGGNYPYVKGTVTKSGTAYTDYCNTGSSVREYYCTGTDVYSTVFACPSGYECSDGTCVETVHTCTDSDGTDIYTYGYITYDSANYYDYCANSTHILEYYCSGSPYSVLFFCGLGYSCSGGKCIATCSDSDGGVDISERGTARYGSSYSTDSCSSRTTVTEYYCGLTGILSTAGVCSSGNICYSGECVEECSDTDGGNFPYVYGTATFDGRTYTDECMGENTVREYFCEDGVLAYTDVECTAGEIHYCSSGRCFGYS